MEHVPKGAAPPQLLVVEEFGVPWENDVERAYMPGQKTIPEESTR